MNRQFQILNRQEVEKTWGVTAEARSAEILIYDEISPWGITAKDVVTELQALDVDDITVRINSPGGDVFDGLAIVNALRDHKATIHTQVDGLAASIASIIALASDAPTMHEESMLMIHNPWMFAVGDAREFRKTAETLDKVGGVLASMYAHQGGMSLDDAQAMMDADTWLTAEEALEAGLISSVIKEAKPSNLARFDISAFGKQPESYVPEPVDLGNQVRSMRLRLQEISL